MSEFIVSARKYRPQRFSDVVGQAHVSQTLKNALRQGQVAHAFLFCGPRGVGKTTNARILAKILNCTDRSADFEACGVCNSCTSFDQSASFNIFELDAASNNSVEHIRGLVEQTRIPPQQGKYKVFIIDEVHMLSSQAFNAFLKTLEEPPAHAIFILATTEKHKIIPTILSRCQIFDFRRIQVPDAVAHLAQICELEGVEAESEALHLIAQKADGAMRDALSIFDRILSASTDKKLRYADVVENLNVLDYDYFFRITDAFLAEDLSRVLLIFDEIMRRGFEGDQFIGGLAAHLRDVLVCQSPETWPLLEVGDSVRQKFTEQAGIASTAFLLSLLNLCNECDLNYKQARHKRLHVEMSLIKMTHVLRILNNADFSTAATVEKKTPVERIMSQNARQNAGNTPTTDVSTPKAPSAPTPVSLPEEPVESRPDTPPGPAVSSYKAQVSNVQDTPRVFGLEEIAAQIEEEALLLSQAVSRLSLESLNESWNKFAETRESPSLKAALLAAQLVLDGKKVLASVGSELYLGFLKEEGLKLSDFLRFDLSEAELSIEARFDAALAPEEKTMQQPALKYLSPRQKLQMMMEINPLVNDLAKTLGLKPDE
jgi:DNA polymerase III subunit gamma/tau